jgi:hypothetical protein
MIGIIDNISPPYDWSSLSANFCQENFLPHLPIRFDITVALHDSYPGPNHHSFFMASDCRLQNQIPVHLPTQGEIVSRVFGTPSQDRMVAYSLTAAFLHMRSVAIMVSNGRFSEHISQIQEVRHSMDSWVPVRKGLGKSTCLVVKSTTRTGWPNRTMWGV